MAKQKLKTTEKQTAANRRNAQNSTGPITPSGKAKASQNALKHGLLAREVVADAGAESREEFTSELLGLHAQFVPEGLLEEMLVEKIAVAYWRLRRAHRYEVGLILSKFDKASGQKNPLANWDEWEAKEPVDVQIAQAHKRLQKRQKDMDKLVGMRDAGKDLQEIYDWSDSWEDVCSAYIEIIDEVSSQSPESTRRCLREAGWADDDIWESHIEVNEDQIKSLQIGIRRLQKEKEIEETNLEARRKLDSIPDAEDLNRLLRYEGAMERQFYKAIDQLERLQRMRAGHPVPAPVNIDVTLTEAEQQ